MGRREGTIEPRVRVAVSEEMARLRRTQNRLNAFWANTELCYAYVLSHRDTVFADRERRSVEVLGHLTSEVWYPSHQGRLKRDETVEAFLDAVALNTVGVYRSTLIAFYSAFEVFLERRVGSLRTGSRWGPFAFSLQRLRTAPWPLLLTTVLRADLCRRLRNMLAHGETTLPQALDGPPVHGWRRELERSAKSGGWSEAEAHEAAGAAVDQVIGEALRQIDMAAEAGKALPVDYFYMLFAFTNLDSLAFEIEEALIAEGEAPRSRVSRKAAAVRREDLKIAGPPGGDQEARR